MAISHIGPVAAANVSAFGGVAKANISAINGVTASFGGGGGLTYAPVTWTDLVDVTESPTGTLTRVGLGDGFTAGAFSVEGFAGDGGARWTIDDVTDTIIFGVSEVNTNVNFNTIDYCFFVNSASDLRVYENGSNRGTMADPADGDVLEIIRTGTTIDYKVNGSTVYTSGVASTGTLYVDVTLYTENSVLNGVEIAV